MDTKTLIKKSMAVSATAVLVVTTLVAAIFTVGPMIERALFPVVDNVHVNIIKAEDHFLQLSMVGNKVRRHCKIDEIQVLVNTQNGVERGTVYFKDPATGVLTTNLVSRPGGQQSFDIWYVFPKGSHISAVARHQCHPFWYSYTNLFELDVTRK